MVKPAPLDAAFPALAQTVERLEALQRRAATSGENDPRSLPVAHLKQLVENARTLEAKIPNPSSVPMAVASSLRKRLVEFEDFAPRDLPQQNTLELLARWRNEVSCQEALNKDESAAVLGALLRGERAIAELQRAEAACSRRWAAMSQEAHQLVDRIKGFKSRAQTCQERQRNMTLAAGHQRKELWAQRVANVQKDRGAAEKVYDELIKLDSHCQQLQSAIGNSKTQLHKLDSKRRQALRSVDSFSNWEAGSSPGISVDEVVDAELEVEKLLWELFELERTPCDKAPQVPQVPQGPQAPVEAFGPIDTDSHEILMDSLPPTVAPASPSFAQPEVESDPADADPAPTDGLVELTENPMATGSPVTPSVANLIHRLSMSRDERRQHERDRKAGNVEDPPVVLQDPSVVGDRCTESPVEPPAAPQCESSEWPDLPECVEGDQTKPPERSESLPWKSSSPEVIWGELPSAPLQPPPLRPVAPIRSKIDHRVILEWDT